MPQKVIDLRPNRAFIKSNFDGYKLSLDTIPVIRQNLDIEPLRKKPSEDQYSFLHAELFALQNFLVQDPWNRSTCYFINAIGHILKCTYGEDGRPLAPETVYKVALVEPQHYNTSFIFISEKLVILSMGNNELVLLNTGFRYKSSSDKEWEEIHRQIVGDTPFFLRDSRSDYDQGKNSITFVLQTIYQKEVTFVSELLWGCLSQEGEKWSYQECDRIVGSGSLYYCSLEPKSKGLVISSNKEYLFQSQEVKKEPEIEKEIKHNFLWTQTNEDITIKFPYIPSEGKNCKVSLECSKFKLDLNEKTVFHEDLFSSIDNDLTIWNFDEEFLTVTLTKTTSLPWPHLFENGPLETGPVPMENQPIVNLEAPIEDCDFPIGMDENEVSISRLSLDSKETSHKIYLGNTPVLFSTILRPGFPAALVTRQDVDASVWLQNITHTPDAPSIDWSLRHEGNLHAFGYVQASKQQKKFMDCSPDLSYSVICESHRHVFLYKAKYETADGLRNRSGPQVTVGKQHLVTLEDCGEVLGLRTAEDFAVLLTEKCILYLQIN
ncbi:NUDCD1 family protein [Megaselia abdita]